MTSYATKPPMSPMIESGDVIIARNIQQALLACGHTSFLSVDVKVNEGRVAITGRVPTYYLKQLVQCLVMQDPSVKSLENDIEVQQTPALCGAFRKA